MPSSILFPLDYIQPSDLLNDYAEWIYFALVLVFFISISGITLRRHFDKPYVKPLIISTGLIMTVGVFMMKERLTIIFQGWGIIGSILLVFMAASIPYGLCRGFGMSSQKAFYLAYILFYIISWVKYPDLYYILADHNLGLVNLGMLILFIVAIYKVVKFKSKPSDLAKKMQTKSPLKAEIDEELHIQDQERKLVKKSEKKFTKFEIKTIKHIEEALAEIHHIIETHRNNLSTDDRKSVAEALNNMSGSENLFMKGLQAIKETFKRLTILDDGQIKEMHDRLGKVTGKEKQILETEIKIEEEKIRIERSVLDCEQKLENWLKYFNSSLSMAIKTLQESAYPYDAMPYLTKARVMLKDILILLQKMKSFEDKLLQHTKGEKKLLKKERRKA